MNRNHEVTTAAVLFALAFSMCACASREARVIASVQRVERLASDNRALLAEDEIRRLRERVEALERRFP
jgi:hypothetical protein